MKKESIEQANELNIKKEEDLSKWYNQVLQVSELIDKRYIVKGCYVWLPYGYKAIMKIKKIWDKLFQEAGIQETYFPLLVPVEYAKQNDQWFNGFKEEAFWVKGYNKEKADYILRPTGEPAMYPMFALWTRTKNDLPIRIYETVSSFRHETKHTIPLIRDREITVWHEIHTVHATKEEAEKEVELHIKLNNQIWENLCLEPLRVKKPQWECFPGAVGAIEYYSIIPNGKAMENGSLNNLGQAYAKKFNIKFKDEQGKENYAWQVCTGNGARLLAALILIHGDDKGLIMPPKIAPIQVVLTPIFNKDNKNKVLKKADELNELLKKENIRAHLDNREIPVGKKFYNWEIKGIPIRIELGLKEIENNKITLANRLTSEKTQIKEDNLIKEISIMLDSIHNSLYENCKRLNKKLTKEALSLKEVENIIKDKKMAKVSWCGSNKCWNKIKKITDGIELFGTDLKQSKGKCIICKENSNEIGYVANTY